MAGRAECRGFVPLNWEVWLPPSIAVDTRRDSGDSRLRCPGESGVLVCRRQRSPMARRESVGRAICIRSLGRRKLTPLWED